MFRSFFIAKTGACLWACLLLGTAQTKMQALGIPMEIEVRSVEVNDLPLPPEMWKKDSSGQLPSLTLDSVHSLRIRFQERFPDTPPARKLRYFLSGKDTEWHTLRAHAQLTVRFLDGDGAIIGSEDFNADGESPGWLGNVSASDFSPRSAKLTAPARSKRVQLLLISSIPEMLGQYAVRDISFDFAARENSPPRQVSISTDQGVEMDKPGGNPLLWARSGTRAQLAQVSTLRDGKHALALIDNESSAFGAWVLKPTFSPEVREGDQLVLTWSECFSLGRGRDGSAVYQNLPTGNYNLLVAGRDLEGREILGSTILSFRVPAALWERPTTWLLGCVVVAGVVFVFTRHVAKQRMQRHLAQMERLHVVEKERSRIARDIHDELGASLAAIALMSKRTRQWLPNNPEAAVQLEEISRRATKTARQLAEIVWAVNPARDSIQHLVEFVCEFAQEHLELANVRFRAEIPDELPEIALSSSARHEVFLASKEIIHNAVRHGHPNMVFLRVLCGPKWLTLEMEDNGCGFAPEILSQTRGLANVAERMKQVGGEFHLHSAPGQGTRIKLCVPLAHTNSSS